jgi:hypothetical protein
MSKEAIVYWSSTAFDTESEQWNLLYSEPKRVIDNLISDLKPNSLTIKCPAIRDALRNVYSIHSNIDEKIVFPTNLLNSVSNDTTDKQYPLPVESSVSLFRMRPTSYDGYVNVGYNLNYIFASEESINIKMTPPYMPAVSPVKGAIMPSGRFNIGEWFRTTSLDYHLPVGAKEFSLSVGDPLAFFEFETDKEIVFKRFKMTRYLRSLQMEFQASPSLYGKNKTLKQRYAMAKRSGAHKLVLSEIKNNLV